MLTFFVGCIMVLVIFLPKGNFSCYHQSHLFSHISPALSCFGSGGVDITIVPQ